MRATTAVPGLVVAGALGGGAPLVPGRASPLAVALVDGALLTNLQPLPPALAPGMRVAASTVMRTGVVLGIRAPAALLVAAGFAICGTSAVSAIAPLTDARRAEIAYAVGLLTLSGTLSVALLPLLQAPFGLSDTAFGVWVGASVHDTGQVVAAAALGSEQSVVPEVVLDLAAPARTALLAIGMVGLGSAVQLSELQRMGLRPLALGLLSWFLLAGGTLLGVLLVTAGPGSR